MSKDIPYDQKYYDPEIECMPRPDLEALQLQRLKDMVVYAYENTVYYKRAFDEAGVAPSDLQALADIAKFPFCDKKTERETQHVGTFFGEMCSVPEEEVVFMATSSGSTGVPTVSPFTQEDFDLWQDTEARLFWQAGMRPNDRYVHALNFALYVGGPDVIGAQRLGALAIWVGAVPSDRLLFVLKQYQPTIIWTSPSYAWHLGEIAKEKGFDPKEDFNIHTIIVAGEAGGSIKSTREAIENLWGAKVVDFYGLSDIYGACAAACEAHDGLHIVEDQILVETVDPTTGEVLAPGETGELVYTTLCKKARPMIRFRTGDIGYVSTDTCECGRTLARIHVTGRKDEMFIVGAVNVFPSDVEYVVRAEKGLTGEYLIRVYDENFSTQTLVFHGATPEILYEAHPHIGTDRLPGIMQRIRQTIVDAGGVFRFESRVTDLKIEKGRIGGVWCGDSLIEGAAVVLATGHSARDIYELLHRRGVRIEAKPFAMGVRIEHPQALIDSIQYHCETRGEYLP